MPDSRPGVVLQHIEVPARDACLPALVELWEASVRASHDFLPGGEVGRLMPWVESALAEIPALIVARRAERPAAFMGLEGKKIEMLFVHPAYFRRGIGSLLLRHAAEKYAAD